VGPDSVKAFLLRSALNYAIITHPLRITSVLRA